MATAHDVAAYIRARFGDVDPLTLQKFLYYAQGWTLAWDGRPLFHERIQAWSYGPVVSDVWRAPRDLFMLAVAAEADEGNLDAREAGNVASVVVFYSQYTGNQLMRMTHLEDPWRQAHGDRPEFEPSTEEITRASMLRYFTRQLAERRDGPRRLARHEPVKDEDFQRALGEVDRWRPVLLDLDDPQ